jgi:Fur family ferric uptake transcriptional regulator
VIAVGCQTAAELAHARHRGRKTRQQSAVVHTLSACRDFVSAQQLQARMSATGVQVALSTVYRILRELEVLGRADVVHDEAGGRRYRPRPAGGHRRYVRCRRCDRSQAVDSEVVERWAERIAAEAGFVAAELVVELTGICAACRRAEGRDEGGGPRRP